MLKDIKHKKKKNKSRLLTRVKCPERHLAGGGVFDGGGGEGRDDGGDGGGGGGGGGVHLREDSCSQLPGARELEFSTVSDKKIISTWQPKKGGGESDRTVEEERGSWEVRGSGEVVQDR